VTLQQVTVPFYTSRIDTQTGIILTGFSTLNSWYHGVVFSVRKPFSKRHRIARELHAEQGHRQRTGDRHERHVQRDRYAPGSEESEAGKLLSDLDQRHRFVTSLYWVPPFSKISNKPTRLLLNGFSFGGIVTIASAGPSAGFISGAPFGAPDFGVTGGEVSSFGGFTGGPRSVYGPQHVQGSNDATAPWISAFPGTFPSMSVSSCNSTARRSISSPHKLHKRSHECRELHCTLGNVSYLRQRAARDE